MSEVRIPEGYKQTEVGVIPQNWETKNIGKDATLKARIGWQALTTNEYQSTGNYYLVTGTDFNAGEVQWDTCWYVDEWRYKQDLNIQLRIDDVLVTKDGTIGKVGYVDELPKPATLNSGVFVIRPKYNSFVPKYFFYVLTSNLFKEFIRNITAGSTITHLYQKDFVTFNFPVPPKKEQTAIATALSDIDNLIQSLEKLIAKKEAIKTGTMQQLLTGKTRLPDFATREDGSPKGFKQTELGQIPEDWELLSVREISDLLTGFPFPSSKYQDSGIRLLRGSNVKRGNTDWSENITKFWAESAISLEQYLLQEGDVVISMDGSLVGRSFAQLSGSDLPALLLQRVARLRTKLISQNYLKEWICSPIFSDYCDSVKTVTAIPHISPADILNFRLLIPQSKEEQTAIATILSDMDAEIQALQQRLEKTRDIKQGMMQQLLTGKVRLVH